MDYRSLVNKLEAIQRGTVAEATAPITNPYKDPAQAAKFNAMTDADQAWLTKGGGVPDIDDQYILARAPNKGQPDPNKSKTNATNTSNEFIKKRLGQLKNLVARIRSTGAPAGGATSGAPAQSGKSAMKPPAASDYSISGGKGWDAPGVKESLHSSLSNILKEEFGYDLSEKVTLGTGPATTDPTTGVTAGKFQKEVALIRKIMAELADIDDPAVIAALMDAQAALDELEKGSSAGGSNDKEKDRARMKELVTITKKPPVSDSDMEESYRPASLSESMGAIRNKLLLLEAPLPVPAGASRGALATRPNLPAKRPGAYDDVIDVDARVIPNKPSGLSMGQKVAGTIAGAGGAAGIAAGLSGGNKDDGSYDRAEQARLARQGTPPPATASARDPNGAYRGDRTEVKPTATASARDPNGAYRGDRTEVTPTATAAAPADAPAQSGKEPSSGSDYTIVKGDNLTKISKKFGVSIQDIMKANPYIKDPNLIYAGKTLKIPGGSADQGGGPMKPIPADGFGKTNLTKWYANEMKELETLIGKYANDPEMADDVKAAQAQLSALKATGQ